MIFHQKHRFLAIARHSQHKIFTQNLQNLVFFLPFMTLEFLLILEFHLKLFQKQYNSVIQIAPNDPHPPYGYISLFHLLYFFKTNYEKLLICNNDQLEYNLFFWIFISFTVKFSFFSLFYWVLLNITAYFRMYMLIMVNTLCWNFLLVFQVCTGQQVNNIKHFHNINSQ